MIKSEHLKDIDFRTRAERQKDSTAEFIRWYNELARRPHSDLLQGQLSMLSAVLWYLLPEKDFRKLTKLK